MTLVTPTQVNPGDDITANSVNAPVNEITAVVNGNIDDTNISSVSGGKLADASVTDTKLDNTAGKIAGAWTTWTPTITGYSADPTGGQYLYRQVGKTVDVSIREENTGTSNSTSLILTLPVTAKSTAYTYQMALGTNNGTLTSASIIVDGATSTTTVRAYVGATLSNWTASGAKRLVAANFTYEAA